MPTKVSLAMPIFFLCPNRLPFAGIVTILCKANAILSCLNLVSAAVMSQLNDIENYMCGKQLIKMEIVYLMRNNNEMNE